MTPQERELILGVVQRLRTANLTQKDSEAERLILTEIGSQKDALYLLTQAVIVQEQGLRHAQERIQQLESACSQQGHGGFLSGLFGGGGSSAPPPPQPPPQAPAGGGGIGTFLGTAAAAAAGAVGGQLIYDGMRNLFGGHGMPEPQPGGGFLGGNVSNVFGPGSIRGSRSEPQDTDYSGGGGDFGGEQDASESGGDFGGDAADSESGGDFGGEEEGEDSDFEDADSSDDDSQGGGDF
jgi:hypothetical protein